MWGKFWMWGFYFLEKLKKVTALLLDQTDVRKMYFPHIILMWGKCTFLTLFWCEENVFSSHYFDVRKMYFPHIFLMWGKCIFLTLFDVRKMYFPHIVECEENLTYWMRGGSMFRQVGHYCFFFRFSRKN